jgi:hypothetical protein
MTSRSAVSPVARTPVWSQLLTVPVARAVPEARRPAVLATIKAVHTAIFASVGGAILLFVWDGLRQRPGRRAAIAFGVIITESAVYASNNQVCPLTPLAEDLGTDRGSVADIFLPDWIARRIPLFGGTALLLGIVLNLRAALSNRIDPPERAN